MMTDPIADMFARLRNAQAQGHATVKMPASRVKRAVLDVLLSEGYIAGITVEGEQVQKTLTVELKYHQGKPVIASLTRVSKPGRRVYSQATELPMVANGLGVTIVSTSKGVLSDAKARALNVGGEVLGTVF